MATRPIKRTKFKQDRQGKKTKQRQAGSELGRIARSSRIAQRDSVAGLPMLRTSERSTCECGCGKIVGIGKRFIWGHNRRVQPMSQQTLERIQASKVGRRRPEVQGELHPRWKGEDASRRAIHYWLDRHCPKKGVCEHCGAIGPTDYANLLNHEEYPRDRSAYAELCSPCHTTMDNLDGARTT